MMGGRTVMVVMALITVSVACVTTVHAGDCNRCNLPTDQGGCKCDSNCDCIGSGGKCDKCNLPTNQGGCKCDSNCNCAGSGGKCDKCNLPTDQGGCKCDSNCDCAGSGGKCDKCNLPTDQGGCKCDSNCDCAGSGGKCDKCNLPTDQGGCKCDSNCDCSGGGSLQVVVDFGPAKVLVQRSLYSDLIRNANMQRVNEGASTQEVQDGDANTLSFVVQAFGDRNLNWFIAGITHEADKLGLSFADQFFQNLIADGFDHMPSSVVITAYQGDRVAAQYSIFRTASSPPPAGSCDKQVGNIGAITAAFGAVVTIGTLGAGTAAAAGVVAAGSAISASGSVLSGVQAFTC